MPNADGCETGCPGRDITAGLPAGHARDVPRARHVRGYPRCSVPVLFGTHDGHLALYHPSFGFRCRDHAVELSREVVLFLFFFVVARL